MWNEIFKIKFLSFGIVDFIDIILVALLMYFVYRELRGSIALNILLGLISVVVFYWVFSSLGMSLMAFILGKFIEVWVILMLIVFQPEVRRFLIKIGQNYGVGGNSGLAKLFFNKRIVSSEDERWKSLISATIINFSKAKVGALIVFAPASQTAYYSGGVVLNATISDLLLESIFLQKSNMHDGAVIIANRKIERAGVVLPVSANTSLPKWAGIRHRAGLGITEELNCIVLIVSEETGRVSKAYNGKLYPNISNEELLKAIDDGLKGLF